MHPGAINFSLNSEAEKSIVKNWNATFAVELLLEEQYQHVGVIWEQTVGASEKCYIWFTFLKITLNEKLLICWWNRKMAVKNRYNVWSYNYRKLFAFRKNSRFCRVHVLTYAQIMRLTRLLLVTTKEVHGFQKELISACICSSVLPLVSGTTLITNRIASALPAA